MCTMMKADVPLAQLHSSETAGWYCRHRKKWVQWRGLLASGSTNVSWGTKLSLVVLLETSCIIIVWLNPNLLSKTMQCWSQMRSFFFFSVVHFILFKCQVRKSTLDRDLCGLHRRRWSQFQTWCWSIGCSLLLFPFTSWCSLGHDI